MSFLYPYGATLNVMKPSTALLSTGSVSFPLNRPVCALYENRVSIWTHSIPNPCQIHFRFFFLSVMPFCKRSSCIKCQIFTRIIFYERTLVSHWPKCKCWINWVLFFFNVSGFTLEEGKWTDTNFEHWSSQTCEFVLAA